MEKEHSIFFDAHFHAMSINHPNFIAFLHELESNFPDEVVSGMFSPGYLLNYKGSTVFVARLQNLLSVIERSIGEIFILMEQDLSTEFDLLALWTLLPKKTTKRHAPFISDGVFHMRSHTYEQIGLCPLIMDFTQTEQIDHGVYSHTYGADRLINYIEDTLEGIRHYKRLRPEGLFRFFPFLGINTAAHDISFIKDLLSKYIISDLDTRKQREQELSHTKQFCYGIKLYPPLGFDPWPEDDIEEMKKVHYLYNFCVEHRIPITTHCDDQGFRTISTKKAWAYSSPKRWKQVLSSYPDLIIDFAHFGKQYHPAANMAAHASNLGMPSKLIPQIINTWYYEILALMLEYDHVYADFSFSGSNPGFYKQLNDTINNYSGSDKDKIMSRSLFGTDFFVNLSKVNSYSNFYQLFEASPFTDEQIDQVSSKNVLSWLQLD